MAVLVDVAVIGGGPAGMTAAVEAASAGGNTVLIDNGLALGGQLNKQIHKFFGSRHHWAGNRGMDIARALTEQVGAAGAVTWLDSSVYNIGARNQIDVVRGTLEHAGAPARIRAVTLRARVIVLATGALENTIAFEGWTLPGVMGAGAAQTMVNVHRVVPGRRVLMVGSGNVGLIVAYQLLQAGVEVAAIVEAAPQVGGYGVHAAKVRRAGVPILTRHTILRAHGECSVEGAVIVELDGNWRPIPGSESEVNVDTICLAVGLRPNARLALMAGCRLTHSRALGGWMPAHDERMMTNVQGVYVAGDLAGVEEASTALEEGRLAGVSAAESLGLIPVLRTESMRAEIAGRLAALRMGPFGEARQRAKEQLRGLVS